MGQRRIFDDHDRDPGSRQAMMESLIALERAGADRALTYVARARLRY
jgi:delta-aminolevulinic acid dehydratase/porphobilinogen synthase